MVNLVDLSRPDPVSSNPIGTFGRPKYNNLTTEHSLWLSALVDDAETGMTMGAADIAGILAQEVHGGILGAGEMLPSERDLCSRFGVGRSTIREAVNQLGSMRLVTHRKGHRPRVVYPTLSDLLSSISDASQLFFKGSEGGAHLEQARLLLETSLARYAAEWATPAQIGRMVAAIEKADLAVDDLPRFRDADVQFHRVLAEIPGNPIFLALHDAFVDNLMRARSGPQDVLSHNRRSNDEHKGLVQAIMARDANAADAILTKHLTRNYAVYVNHVLTPKGMDADASED